jgi:hypothetical protein
MEPKSPFQLGGTDNTDKNQTANGVTQPVVDPMMVRPSGAPTIPGSQASNDTTKTIPVSEGESVTQEATDLPSEVGESATASTATTQPTEPAPFASAAPTNSVQPNEPVTENTPSAPVADAAPVASGSVEPAPVVGTKPKKKWLIPVAAGTLIALLAGGYVFGIYLPNRPENAYKIGMKLTGIATDRVINYTKERKKYASSSIDATASVKQAGGSFDMAIKGESSETAGIATVDANITGQKINAELRVADAAQSENPDVYLKLTGVTPFLQQMSADPKLAQLDGKWIAIDHTIIDTYQKQIEAQSGASIKEMPTADQVNDAVAKVQQVNKDYLFTTNKDKAVLQYKEYVGKDTRNNRAAFHYKTGYDKAHLKEYVKAVGKALDSSKLNDWSKKQADGKNLSALFQLSSLEDTVEKTKGDETFDLYVDQGTKLIQSVVFTDKKSDGGTFTIAQNYTGGDKYPFEISAKGSGSNKIAMVLGATVDTKTDKVNFSAKLDSDASMSFSMSGTMTPSNKKLSVEAPTGAVPLAQVLQQFGVDPSVLMGSGVTTPATTQPTASTTRQM